MAPGACRRSSAGALLAEPGIEPAARETYDNDVREVTHHDLGGNEFGFGGRWCDPTATTAEGRGLLCSAAVVTSGGGAGRRLRAIGR